MRRIAAFLLALLLGLCPLTAAATKPSGDAPDPESPQVPEMNAAPVIPDPRHFDTCNVTTTVGLDGTVSRSITFTNFYERETAMRMLFGSDLEDQLRRRATLFGGRMEYSNRGGESFYVGAPYATYYFAVDQVDPEQALAFTNSVMQTENCQLEVTFAPRTDCPGCVTVSVCESFDTSNCLDEGALLVENVYGQVAFWDASTPQTFGSSFLVRTMILRSGEAALGEADLNAPFEKVTVTVDAGSTQEGRVSLSFIRFLYALPIFWETAVNGLKQAAQGRAEVTENRSAAPSADPGTAADPSDASVPAAIAGSESVTLTFSGTPEEITQALNGFVQAYVPENGAVPPGLRCYYPQLFSFLDGPAAGASLSDPVRIVVEGLPDASSATFYLSSASSSILKSAAPTLDLLVEEADFSLFPLETADRFKTALGGFLRLDLRPVTGRVPLVLQAGEGVELIPQEAQQFDAGLFSDPSSSFDFILTKRNYAPLILLIPGVLLILAAAALFIRKYRVIRSLFPRPAPAAPEQQPLAPSQEEEEPVAFEIPEIVIAGMEEDEP